MRRRPAAGSGAALLLLLLGSCGGEQPQRAPGVDGSPVDGDWLIATLAAEPTGLDPLLVSDKPGIQIARLIGDSLVDQGPDLSYVPRLAERWGVSSGGRVITFHLRPGVRWHDGAPFSSADVLFTYEAAMEPARGTRFLTYFSQVESVEAPDDRTVRATYRAPFSPMLQGWEALIILPRHRFPDGYEQDLQFARDPLGTGPFRLQGWNVGRDLTLDANPEYWYGRPHLDRLVFRVMPEPQTAWGALLAGEVDVAALPDGREPPGPEERPAGRRLKVESTRSNRVTFIAWNADGSNPFFGDPRVRRAMTLAIDRAGILRAVLHGRGVPATSTFVPGTWAHHDGLQPLPHDPAEAARLLEEAGWRIPPGERWRRKDGVPFHFSALYAQVTPRRGQVGLLMQDELARIGVQVTLEPEEWAALIERKNNRQFEALIHAWNLDLDPDPFDFWHSSQLDSGWNVAAYGDPDVDRWCEEGRRTFDPAERAAIYRKVQERLQRDQPCTFLFHRDSLLGYDARLRGFRDDPTGPWRGFPGPVEWWVPASEQRYPAGAR